MAAEQLEGGLTSGTHERVGGLPLVRAALPEPRLPELAAAQALARAAAREEMAADADPAEVGGAFRVNAAGEGVTFPQGHLWLASDIARPDPCPVLDTLKRWIDLFVAVGVRAAVLHPGGGARIEAGQSPEQLLAARIDALKSLVRHIGDADLTLCLENIVRTAPEVTDLLEIIAAVGSGHLGICLDTGHLNITGGDQGEFIRAAGPLLQATHLADNEGQTDQHLMPYGRGTVNWAGVSAALREGCYTGLWNLEIPGEIRAPKAVRVAKMAYLRELMRILWEEGGASA